MANAFVSYAVQDRDFVAQLVAAVEREGHRLWHFERDSMPAGLYLEEISKAIESCDFVLLVVSSASLDSFHVTKEVEHAYEKRKRFLPVLLDVASEDIPRFQPIWAAALGTTSHVRRTPQGMPPLVQEVVRVCRACGEEPRRPTAPWVADGQLIDIPALEQVVFQTSLTTGFVVGHDQFFISANKGVGKTLLLKCKRAHLMLEHSRARGRADVAFIPEGRPYLDFMGGGLPSMKKSLIDFLSDLRNCQRLWSFALRMAVLAHFPQQWSLVDRDRVREAAGVGLEQLVPHRATATTVFRGCLGLSVSDINRLLDRMETSVEHAFRQVHSGASTFIDRVDQGLVGLPREAWIHIQAGLIEAAWDVMSSNNHVKIFATIREEAYASYASESKNNLFTATLPLRYGAGELQEMIDSLARLYESAPSLGHFVGMHTVADEAGMEREDVFQHLLRHTLGRPRDLIMICAELSRGRSELDAPRLREIVREISGRNVVSNVFHEMAVFLRSLVDAKARGRLFGLIPWNVLTRSELEAICCEFNGLGPESAASFRDLQSTLEHPFCELFNCGLIGTVQDDPAGRVTRQQFKQPHDIVDCLEGCLPRADYYLIHPALESLIERQRAAAGYQSFRWIVVGQRCPWRGYDGELVDLQKALGGIDDPEIRRAIVRFVDATLAPGAAARPAAIDELRLAEIQGLLERRGHDDVWLLLDRFAVSFRQACVAWGV
ncbi:MAG: toll/interleukin-1 receptor domain-containing protein [Cyanobium sp.]